jgi:hypothetical protein
VADGVGNSLVANAELMKETRNKFERTENNDRESRSLSSASTVRLPFEPHQRVRRRMSRSCRVRLHFIVDNGAKRLKLDSVLADLTA